MGEGDAPLGEGLEEVHDTGEAKDRGTAPGPATPPRGTTAGRTQERASGLGGVLFEQRAGMEQIRGFRGPATALLCLVPLVFFGALLWLVRVPDIHHSVLVAISIGTFAVAVVVYGFLMAGLYRITRQDYSRHPLAKTLWGSVRDDEEP